MIPITFTCCNIMYDIYQQDLHTVTLSVTFTNKISSGGEPSLAVSAGVGLGMCPGVSCSHIYITLKTKLTATDPNLPKYMRCYSKVPEIY